MSYARLRAIETRKWVARSANTGISCFIDPLGNVINPQPWDTEASIKMTVPVDRRQTFFVKHGDVLSRAAGFVSILLLLLSISVASSRKFRIKKYSLLSISFLNKEIITGVKKFFIVNLAREVRLC